MANQDLPDTITVAYCAKCNCPIGATYLCSYECEYDASYSLYRPVVQKTFARPAPDKVWVDKLIRALEMSQRCLAERMTEMNILFEMPDLQEHPTPIEIAWGAMSFIKDTLEEALAKIPKDRRG